MKKNIKNFSVLNLLIKLWWHLDRVKRRQFILMIFLMILSSFAEVISMGALIPFLASILEPERILSKPFIINAAKLFSFYNADGVFLFITITFISAIIFATLLRTFLLFSTTRISFETGADLTNSIYLKIINQQYSDHINTNSSEIISAITVKTNEVIFYILMPLLSLVTSLIMVLIIFSYLVKVLPYNILICILAIALIYLYIVKKTSTILKKNSSDAALRSTYSLKILQESLGGIRDVLINNLQLYFYQIFEENDRLLRKAQSSSQYISQFPKYVVEAMGMLMIIVISYISTIYQNGLSAIPILAVLALGAQRLLPALQQIYYSRTVIVANQSSLADIIFLLDRPLRGIKRKNSEIFSNTEILTIEFKNIFFKYHKNDKYILNDINFSILKGDRVALIGETGCGKSTLVDILMGLLQPTNGVLMVNNIAIDESNVYSWQSEISHVPQTVFLSDASIAENIAFGVPRDLIDYKHLMDCARRACIATTIEKMPQGYETLIGERGVFLSGGQRQRLGIARALYKKALVIVLDEATSALDEQTEADVMSSLYSLGESVTLVIIAHRLSTISLCNRKFKISNHGIKELN